MLRVLQGVYKLLPLTELHNSRLFEARVQITRLADRSEEIWQDGYGLIGSSRESDKQHLAQWLENAFILLHFEQGLQGAILFSDPDTS